MRFVTRMRACAIVVLSAGFVVMPMAPAPRPLADGPAAPPNSFDGAHATPPGLPAGVAADWWTSVRARIDDDGFAVRRIAGSAEVAFEADNPAQRWHEHFTVGGLAITSSDVQVDDRQGVIRSAQRSAPAGSTWTAGLRLSAYGTPTSSTPVTAVAPRAIGARVEYQFGESPAETPTVTEWYVNAAKGIEQGFTVTAAPAGDGPLVLDVSVTGGLDPVMQADERSVELRAADGVARVRYAELFVTDAKGRTLPASLSVPADDTRRIRILVDTRDAEYPVTIDPLLTYPSAILSGESADNRFGGSVATAGDVNGDGYSDIIIGAYGYASGTGRAYLYLGSSTGLSLTPSVILTGASAGIEFGFSVSTAGDVNGDGFADVIIGARSYSGSAGAAYLYLGMSGTVGLATPEARVLTGTASGDLFGFTVAPAGDVNGDGNGDVVVGAPGYATARGRAYVYLGEAGASGLTLPAATTLTGEVAGNYYGMSVATAGDVNGDGYADVVIGARAYSAYTGRAYVYLGGASGLGPAPAAATTLTGSANSHFGISVATAGDVDGDGYADVLVGASGAQRAYLYRGTAGASGVETPAATTLSGTTADLFGYSVSSVGDVNGDGYADVAVGSPAFNASAGRVSVYQGSATGLVTVAAMVTTWNGTSTEWFGTSVATAGDVNGDGHADVLVGAMNANSNAGRAYLYLGGASSLSTTATSSRTGAAAGDTFGAIVATAGDVNGDGYADVVIGAPGYSASTGRAYLFLGSATGLAANASTTLTGEATGNEFGHAVATAGDVNGDGYADVLIGASAYGGSVGRAYLYLGGASGLANSAAAVLTGDANGNSFGFAVATAGDVNGDGYADVVIGAFSTTRPALVYFGGANGLSTVPTTTLTSPAGGYWFGSSVATAGDVNGDGYADVLIGAAASSDATPGRAYVYLGGVAGLGAAPVAATTLTGDDSSFGSSVSASGDVDGDGYADVIVGASYYGNGKGRAYVYHGSGSGLASGTPDILEGTAVGDFFGASVATAGDVNGDGIADGVIGAHGANSQAGRALLYLGAGGGLVEATLSGEASLNTFGRSVASAGDVNGDGYADVIVGAPGYSGSTGRAYLYAGNGGHGRAVAARTRRADDSAPVNVGGRTDSATSFRLAALGHSPFGRVPVKLEWDVKPLGSVTKGTNKSAVWHDTSTAGVGLNELASSLTAARPYRWRVRVLYRASSSPFVQHGRWVTQPWMGARETRIRTKPTSGATPIVTWATPTAITHPTPLGPTQLNAWANVAGMFAYTPQSGTVLNAGAGQTLSVTFTPSDAAYSAVTKTTTIDVGQGTATVTLGGLSQTYNGTPRAVTATTVPAGLPVVFTYVLLGSPNTPVSTPPTNANYYTVVATVNHPSYQGSATDTLVIARATSVITWADPADIVYGTPLGPTQLNATVNAPGTLLYTNQYGESANGLTLPVGFDHPLKAQFIPADEDNYTAALKTVKIDVLPGPTYTRYLAEGATSTFFDTRLAFLNPGSTATVATVTFSRSGTTPVVTTVTVPRRTRVTLDPKTLPGMATAEFSTKVESNLPLIVDRTVSWDATGYGAHAETAVAAPALTWYLAEGATHSGFNLFYLLQNPNAAEAQVRVRFLRPAGAPLEKTYTLPPTSRNNIWVNEEQFPGLGKALAATDVSAILESLNTQPIIVERALYLDLPGQMFGAGHESAGVTAPATQWFLAEGNTGPYFDLYVLIANPGDTAAQVEATYLRPDGTVIVKQQTVAANSRFNIWVDGEDPLLADTAVSTTIRSTNGVPVIVERALWWPGGYGQWYEAHNSPGATATGTRWALAEGEVGGPRGVETYILLANTSPAVGTVKVTVMLDDSTSLEKTFTVAANSRFNVDVRSEFPTTLHTRFGAIVESLGATPAQIVVERAMYWDAGGQHWAAGTNALATKVQ